MDRFQVNRETILSCVQQQLREDLMEFGVARPLGELIPGIALKIRTSAIGNSLGNANIVPLPIVAAFVDGTASVDEDRMVCEAVMVDNSVLAEIVAAVRSRLQQDSIPELDQNLLARLLAMPHFATPTKESLHTDEPALQGIETVQTILPESNQPMVVTSPRSISYRAPIAWSVFAALATSIVAMVWLSGLATRRDPKSDIDPTNLGSTDTKSPRLEIPNQIDPLESEPGFNEKMAELPLEPGSIDPGLDADPKLLENEAPAIIATTPDRKNDVDPKNLKSPIEELQSRESNQAPMRIAGIRWTKITGLLAHRMERPLAAEAAWGGVEIGSRDWESSEDRNSLELKTLPMSRAEASLASGGKIVLAADTGARWKRATQREPDRMELQHGQIAMIDVPQGTELELQRDGKMLGKLHWDTRASVVLGVTASGLQAMIQGGEVSIDNDSRKNTTVIIEPSGITELKERSGRMPAWVAKPLENVVLPKAILAQIASSNNLGDTLTQLIDSEQLDEPKSSLLSTWRASLETESLIRQASVRRPVLRLAALHRIVNTPEWDRRYAGMWSEVAAALGDERKVQLLKSMSQMVRQKGKPNPNQLYALVAFLEAPDIASRSMGDFLLRQFYGNGPVFDPTWNGEANVRGAGLWRRFIAQSASGTPVR